MRLEIDNLAEAIRTTKKALCEALPNHAAIFRQVEAEMRQRVDVIVQEREAREAVIPIVQYEDVEADYGLGGSVSV